MQYPNIHPHIENIPVDFYGKLYKFIENIRASERLGCIYLGLYLNETLYEPLNTFWLARFAVKPGTEEALKEIWNES